MIRWVNKHKNLVITILVSLILFLTIFIISYVIYIYGYYDMKQMNRILENYNSFKFDKVYEDITKEDDEFLDKDSFMNMTNIMYNKINLEKIYNSYYINTNKYKSKDDFIRKYYYGYKVLKVDNVDFYLKGKTDLLHRRIIKVNKYHISNGKNETSTLGIINNIYFLTTNNSVLKIDGKELTCDSLCKLNYLFSGVHSIEYVHDGFTYYTILLIDKSNNTIDMNKLNNLITIKDEINLNEVGTIDNNKELKIGIYSLTSCNLTNNCPATNYSYITLNSDKTCGYYTYKSIDVAGDSYEGSYKIENGYLLITFNKHIYSIYDETAKKNIEQKEDTKMEFTFRIDSNESISNQDLKFDFKA